MSTDARPEAEKTEDHPARDEQGGDTLNERVAAVTRSVRRMQRSIGESHPLQELAQSALLSPYHFHRIFGEVTAATPARFLAATRMARAKTLLVSTDDSVTDICMQVGYSSLGTFTYQFTRLVGVSPRNFRRIARLHEHDAMDDLLATLETLLPRPHRPQVRVTVRGPDDGRRAVIGAFASGIPQAVPASCAIATGAEPVDLGDLPHGRYRILAMSFPPSTSVRDVLLEDARRASVCDRPPRVTIVRGQAARGDEIVLSMRPRRVIDPPLVSAIPLLMAAEAVSAESGDLIAGE